MSDKTIFSKIIDQEIPAAFVYQDDVCVVIMDAFPSVKGQTLVIPRQPTDYIFDLPDDIYQHIFSVAKNIALASDKAFDTSRTCVVVEGFEVPHVHVKLYPLNKEQTALTDVIVHTAPVDPSELQIQADKIKAQM